MLFNSYVFIFLFLPLTLAGYFLLARVKPLLAAAWLPRPGIGPFRSYPLPDTG